MASNSTTSSTDSSILEVGSSYFRIGPEAFTASIFTFLAIAVLITGFRIYLRVRAFGRLMVDDYFMIAAVIFFAASTGITQASRNLVYLQVAVDIGLVFPDPTFFQKMLLYVKLDTAEYMLQWACIFCVKFSYIFFFRPLTSRIRPLQIWWWILVAIMIPTACVTIGLSPWVCPYFDDSFIQHCIVNGSVFIHERIILQISTATDIATDLLVISIPIWLLTSVKLELKRKLALGAVLCLSIFMIIIAVIRYSLVSIPRLESNSTPISDTIWLFFWLSIEACVSIIMVSLTAFRSLYGQEQARSRNTKQKYRYINETAAKRANGNKSSGVLNSATFSSGHGSKNRTIVGVEEEEMQDIGRVVSDVPNEKRSDIKSDATTTEYVYHDSHLV